MVFCVSLFVTWLVIMALSTFITHVSAFSIILHYGIWCCIIATLRLSLMLYIIGIKVDIAVFILQWHYYDPSRGFYLNIFCMDKTNLVVLIGFITLLTFWSISWILSHGLPVTASGTQVIFVLSHTYISIMYMGWPRIWFLFNILLCCKYVFKSPEAQYQCVLPGTERGSCVNVSIPWFIFIHPKLGVIPFNIDFYPFDFYHF